MTHAYNDWLACPTASRTLSILRYALIWDMTHPYATLLVRITTSFHARPRHEHDQYSGTHVHHDALMCDMMHSCLRHDSFMCDTTHSCVTWLIRITTGFHARLCREHYQYYGTYAHQYCYVTWLTRDLYRVTNTIHTVVCTHTPWRDVTHSHVPWLIHIVYEMRPDRIGARIDRGYMYLTV